MCGKNLVKKLSLALLVLVLGCSSLCAWPSLIKREPQIQGQQEEVLQTESESLPEETSMASEVSPTSSEITADISAITEAVTSARKTAEIADEIIAKADAVTEKVVMLETYADDLEAQVQSLTTVNATQADEMAVIKESLNAEKGVRTMLELGAGMGFEDSDPTFNLSIGMGLKWDHVYVITNVGYGFGKFAAPSFAADLDRLDIGIRVGWVF